MSQLGKVALVTGGAQGIGRAIVEALLAEGASVAVLDLNRTVGEETLKELLQKYPGKAVFLLCDVTNSSQFEDCFKSTIDKFKKLDIVVNNAGIGVENGEVWVKMIDINFAAVVRGCKLGVKYMGKPNGGQGGSIVNVGSVTALQSFPGLPVYASTKAAVVHFTKSLGHEKYYSYSGVKIMAINPGLTNTPLVNDSIPGCVADDPVMKKCWQYFEDTVCKQKTTTVGKGVIEVLKKGESGSLWTIENDELPVPSVFL